MVFLAVKLCTAYNKIYAIIFIDATGVARIKISIIVIVMINEQSMNFQFSCMHVTSSQIEPSQDTDKHWYKSNRKHGILRYDYKFDIEGDYCTLHIQT